LPSEKVDPKNIEISQRYYHSVNITEDGFYIIGGSSPSNLVCPEVCRFEKSFLAENASQLKLEAFLQTTDFTAIDPMLILPEELSVEIFEFLTLKELKNAGRVCKQWYLLSQKPKLVAISNCNFF
jgi:hypothetical protein